MIKLDKKIIDIYAGLGLNVDNLKNIEAKKIVIEKYLCKRDFPFEREDEIKGNVALIQSKSFPMEKELDLLIKLFWKDFKEFYLEKLIDNPNFFSFTEYNLTFNWKIYNKIVKSSFERTYESSIQIEEKTIYYKVICNFEFRDYKYLGNLIPIYSRFFNKLINATGELHNFYFGKLFYDGKVFRKNAISISLPTLWSILKLNILPKHNYNITKNNDTFIDIENDDTISPINIKEDFENLMKNETRS
jgi:hypothetical protein